MRLIQRAVAALAVGAFALAVSVGSLGATVYPDQWDTSDIMKKVNGKKGAVGKAGAAVKDGKWDDAAKEIETLKHGADLVKNKPNKGDKESWEKLAKAYGTTTAALASAIEKKDKDAFEKNAKAVGGSCKTCHDAHK
jgi:cytochrome c556